MTYFTTSVAPINVYGDTAQVLEIHDWQAAYVNYLANNNANLDCNGNLKNTGATDEQINS